MKSPASYKKIREEEEAARRGLEGYATVSKHAFITARMETVEQYVEQLIAVTGSEETAMRLIAADQLQQQQAGTSSTL